MKVIIKKGTVAEGKRFNPGEKLVTVSDNAGRILCAYGHAVKVENREEEIGIETRGAGGKAKKGEK